jgi:hypothetical protein
MRLRYPGIAMEFSYVVLMWVSMVRLDTLGHKGIYLIHAEDCKCSCPLAD